MKSKNNTWINLIAARKPNYLAAIVLAVLETGSLILLLSSCVMPLLFVIPANQPEPVTPDPHIMERFFDNWETLLNQSVDELAYIEKRYKITPGTLPAQPPIENFGATSDPDEVMAAIDEASKLLGNESIVGWGPEIQIKRRTQIQYYYDPTILVLVWQEVNEGRDLTWCEVKLADPTQLRRKVSGDVYGYGIEMPGSKLAAEDHAVAAISGDYYAFRNMGARVYEGKVRQVEGKALDTAYFDYSGNIHLVHSWELPTREDVEQYVQDNNINFSVSFGPILVKDGEIVVPKNYPLGESHKRYSRAAIAQVGHLHYLCCVGNVTQNGLQGFFPKDMAQIMQYRGCENVYALDGGQTGEIVMNGAVVHPPDYNTERDVSDMICFASAYPH